MKERNNKISYAPESDNHEIKNGSSGENIIIFIDKVSREITTQIQKARKCRNSMI